MWVATTVHYDYFRQPDTNNSSSAAVDKGVYPLCGGRCDPPRLCSVKNSILDICIEHPALVVQGKGLRISKCSESNKDHSCLAYPGFDVCFGSALCVNDAAQIREMGQKWTARVGMSTGTIFERLHPP